jgi:Cu-Zn family superoxide dismutase
MNFIFLILSIISIKLVLSTVINSSNNYLTNSRNKCHLYNSDNKTETNLLFDRIQVARNCHLQICFKLNNCENYITDTEYITKRKMPISTECICNDDNNNNNNNLIRLKKNKNNSIITLNYLIKSITSTEAINSFEIYMDEIVVFNLTRHSLIECTSGKFGKRIFQTNSFNLTEFNLSISINQYSIKLGINSNKLYEYKSIEKNDLIKSIHFIRLDNRYQLINNSEQVKPIISVNDSYAYHLNQLSIPKQHLFSILHDFSLNSNEIESINYSLTTLNCLLNRTIINKKEKLALIKDDKILLIQLNNFKIYGLSKILKGSLNLKFNHNLVVIANETNIIMTQPQQVVTTSNNDLVIIVTAIENDINETMKSFQNLIQIISNEYKFKQCNSSIELSNLQNIYKYEIKYKAFVLINGTNPAMMNSKIEGKLLIEQIDDEHISISGYLNGLNNNSLHAMHIHETGLVEHNNCKDTGPHFNPLFSSSHGSPSESNIKNKHIGDLGNIQTDFGGSAYLNNLKFNYLTIKWKNIFNVLNRSIVIHQNTDDLGTVDNLSSKSNGNSGPRIACGKIKII